MKNKLFLLVTAILISFGMGVFCHKMFDVDTKVAQQTRTTPNKYYYEINTSRIPRKGYYSDTQFTYIISDSGTNIQGCVNDYIDGQLVCSRVIDASAPTWPCWNNDWDTNMLIPYK